MTQRVFDIQNEKDYADLWDIVPDEIETIYKDANELPIYYINTPEIASVIPCPVGLFKINWHDKTKITRPVYEITGQDIGKICCFWEEKQKIYGKLHHIEKGILGAKIYFINNYDSYPNCRRLTKQEIEEIC